MPDSTLPSRLAHLLIQEDSATGRLFMPDGTGVKDPLNLSPPLTPSSSTFAFEPSPLNKNKSLPDPLNPQAQPNLRLPPPAGLSDHRPYSRAPSSIFPLSHPRSPPSSSPIQHHLVERERELELDLLRPSTSLLPPRRVTSPHVTEYPAPTPPMSARPFIVPSYHHERPAGFAPPSPPHTAPVPRTAPYGPSWATEYPPTFAHDGSLPTAPAGSAFPGRPDMFRRHSGLSPYEYGPFPVPPPHHRPTTGGYLSQTSPTPRYNPLSTGDENLVTGSRQPISRTTKACNACRMRKVRCDAGGLPGGQPSTCSRCKESGVECVYSVVQKKRGPCPGSIRGSGSKPRRRSQNPPPEPCDIPRHASVSEVEPSRPPFLDITRGSLSFPPRSVPQEWTSMPPRPIATSSALSPRRKSSSGPVRPSSRSDIRSSSQPDSRRSSETSRRSDILESPREELEETEFSRASSTHSRLSVSSNRDEPTVVSRGKAIVDEDVLMDDVENGGGEAVLNVSIGRKELHYDM